MSVLDTLITDRTQADVDLARSMCIKGQNMTADELTAFLLPLKGMYNYTDWNRVESAVDYVADELVQADTDLRAYATSMGVEWDSVFEVPYDPDDYSNLTIKTDWAESDIPLASQMQRYIDNVQLILSAIPEASVFWIPNTMDGLTYEYANNIEQVLIDVHTALGVVIAVREGYIRSALAVNYSGEIYSGEGEA